MLVGLIKKLIKLSNFKITFKAKFALELEEGIVAPRKESKEWLVAILMNKSFKMTYVLIFKMSIPLVTLSRGK